MKKRILATAMVLLLTAALLAGCGNSSRDDDRRSSRDRRERSYEADNEDDDSDEGGWFSKWIDGASSEDRGPLGNDHTSPEEIDDITDDSFSNPTDEDDSFIVDDNTETDDDIMSPGGFTSPADNDTPAEGSNVPSSGGNSSTGSSASPAGNAPGTPADDNSAPPAGNTPGTSADDNSTPPAGNAPSVPATGNSNSLADDYLNDIKELVEFSEAAGLDDDDPVAMIAAMQSLVSNLQVKTPEGLAIKADLQDMIDLLNDMMLNMDTWTEDSFDAALNRIMEISEAAEAHLEAFEKAATAAGIDMDSLDELDDILGL